MADEVAPTAERAQTELGKGKSRWRRRVTLAAGLVTLIAAGVVLPPLINIGRYQHRITELMTRSFGRPVRMSSVELRLLPLPGFVLHDLSVSEDPEFGAEPILSARTVVASVRLLTLWRGKLEISRVSVDEASLNLVRTAQGRWNLDSLMVGAQPALTGAIGTGGGAGKSAKTVRGSSSHFPYLEATNSRVNLKNGLEKSPFSLVDADLSLWQDQPGEWRVRLRGQPVRTDMEMSSADAGEVRMEASLHSAAQLHEMPLKLQMEWRDAQLGQLSRLLLGSDAGWRGDLTADIDLQGTVDDLQSKARLRATGVRRAEFAPDTPLDFDANCAFRYQHSENAYHDVGCDTAIGDGRLHLKADLPGKSGTPEAMLEVQQVPLQAGLDLLRTVRSGFAPGISAKGSASGSLTYKVVPVSAGAGDSRKALRHPGGAKASSAVTGAETVPADLQGSIVVDGGELKGGELKEPLELPKITLTPVEISNSRTSSDGSLSSAGLGARFSIPLVSAAPPAPSRRGAQPAGNGAQAGAAANGQAIGVRLGLGARGFEAGMNGSGAVTKLRDLAYAFGLPHLDATDGFASGTADFVFSAKGPWIRSDNSVEPVAVAATNSNAALALAGAGAETPTRKSRLVPAAALEPEVLPGGELLAGSVQLHHAQWKAAYLTQPVELGQSTITVSSAGMTFDSDFSYGGSKETGKDPGKESGKDVIRGSVVVNSSGNCKAGGLGNESLPQGSKGNDCEPQVQLRFGSLDGAQVQTALLGAPEEKTLLSPLIDRMRSTDRPKLPEIAVSLQADTLLLGPTALLKPTARLRFKPNEVLVEEWEAGLYAGSAKGAGRFVWTGDRPGYSFEGSFTHLNAAPIGALVDSRWAGGLLSGTGRIEVSGLTAKEFAASAAGEVHFDWVRGAIPASAKNAPEVGFDDWSGVVSIQGGNAKLGENAMRTGQRSSSVAGTILLGGPANLTVAPTDGKDEAGAVQPNSHPGLK